MENLNPDKNNEIKYGESAVDAEGRELGTEESGLSTAKKQSILRLRAKKVYAQGTASPPISEKVLIASVMMFFALVLLLVAIIVTVTKVVDDPSKDNGKDVDDGHIHTFYTMMEHSDGMLNLVKFCGDCDFREYVEKDVRDATVLAERLPTCGNDGKIIYSLSRDGAEQYYEEILSKTGHKVNGISVDELRNESGYLVYDGENIKIIGGTEFSCGDIVEEGVFICSVCEEACQVAVATAHIPEEDWRPINEGVATCTESAEEALYCKTCQEAIEKRTVPALGHSYNYTLTWNEDLSLFLVKTVCLNDCGYFETEEATTATEIRREEATCGTPERIYYSYEKNGVTLEGIKEGELGDDNHVFDEKEGAAVYDYEEGYTIPIVGNIICGMTSSDFALKCKYCGELKKISVKVPDHEYVFKKVTKKPSLWTGGEVTLVCSHSAWCGKNMPVSIDRIKLGEGGNAVIAPDGGDEIYELVLYKTVIYGVTVEIEIKVPKADLSSD